MTKQWERILVKVQDSIETVIKVIDQSSLQVALVTSENNTLLGMVTDGDVRRGLLRHISLQEPGKANYECLAYNSFK